MIEQAFREENQKFDNDRARKSWVASLRNQQFMYQQTSKHDKSALHCLFPVSTPRQDPAYSTRSSLQFCFGAFIQDESLPHMSSRNNLESRLGKTMGDLRLNTE